MENFKKVSKKEFDDFVNKYPNVLQWDVTGISDPPLGSHNDFQAVKYGPNQWSQK